MRTFIALPLPDVIINDAFKVREQLETRTTKVKWVEKGNYHITVKFLGDTKAEFIDNLYINLANITKNVSTINLKTSKIGFFPNERQPRVIWLGVNGELNKLNKFASKIDYFLSDKGYKEERQRSFHITLGRIRDGADYELLRKQVALVNNKFVARDFIIDRVDFLESHLTSGGPIYKTHKSFYFAS